MNMTGQRTRRNSDSAPAGWAQPTDSRPGAPKSTWQAKMPPRRTWLWFVLVLLANFVLVRLFMPGSEGPVTVP
jgi:cell division protease FtsH